MLVRYIFIIIFFVFNQMILLISNYFVLFKPNYQNKLKELLAKPSNQLQSDDTSGSIAWAPDDVFAKVMGKERKGRICGIRFGQSPSGRSSKSALTDLQIRSSQSRDDEVAQLKASLAKMQEKLSSFDEMKERLSQFEKIEQRMACMLQQVKQITSQCNQVGINDFDFGVSNG